MNSGVYMFIGSMIIAIVVAVLLVFYRSNNKNEDPKNEKDESKAVDDESEVEDDESESEDDESESEDDESEAEDDKSEAEDDESEAEDAEEPDVSVEPVREPPEVIEEDEQEPVIEEEQQPRVIEDTTMASKETARMCVYTNQYERCDTKCGQGKRFRVQVPYNDNLHYDQTPHACVPDEDREFRPCTGIVCDETYTYPNFIKNNPGKGLTEYCEFIKENNACNDNYVRQNSLCSEQCPR